MNTMCKRLVLGACACAVAQLAMAAQPKASVAVDDHNAHVVNVVVNLPEGEKNYHCQYVWQVTLKSGAQAADACHADVTAGAKDLTVCSIKYDTWVSQVVMVNSKCTVAE